VEFENVLVGTRVVPEVCDGWLCGGTVDVLRDGLVDAAGVLEASAKWVRPSEMHDRTR
jgi:hypothetical protein